MYRRFKAMFTPDKRKHRQTRTIRKTSFSLIGRGEESHVYKIRNGEDVKRHGLVIRSLRTGFKPEIRKKLKLDLVKRFIATQIAFEIFPKNVPEMTKLDVGKGRIRMKYIEPDKILKKYQQLYIRFKRISNKILKLQKNKLPIDPLMVERRKTLYNKVIDYQKYNLAARIQKPEVKRVNKALKEAGFSIDEQPENISIYDKKNPVFNEILGLNLEKVHKFVSSSNLSDSKKATIEDLLERYKNASKIIGKKTVINGKSKD